MSQFYENAHLWKFAAALEIVPSFDTGVTSDDSSDDDDSLDTEDDSSAGSDDCTVYKFSSKHLASEPQHLCGANQKTAEKIRDLMYVLDDELQPLSPPSFMNTNHAADQLSKDANNRLHDYRYCFCANTLPSI